MKRYIKCLVLLIISVCVFNVYAIEYNPYDTIPITSTNATVRTKTFNYNGITYNKKLDETSSTNFTFSGIVNNTKKRIPVTITIGLFDKDGKNIGTIFYCTKRDYDSKFSGLEIKSGKSTAFKISVKKKYLVDNKSANEIVSYSILSDNEVCEAVKFDRYKGLTLAEIQDGIKPPDEKKPEEKKFDLGFLKTISGNLAAGFFIISIIIAIIAYIFYCYILNSLYKKMYNTASSLVFVPIVNSFISVKMAFGPIVALIWAGIFGLGVLLSLLNINLIAIFASIILTIALLACIVKLITKKYELFYFDPNMIKAKNDGVEKNKKKDGSDNKFINTNQDAIKQGLLKNDEESLLDDTSAEAVKINLNYSEADVEKASDDYFDVSSGYGDTGATPIEKKNNSNENNLVDFMGKEIDHKGETGGEVTTDYSTILDLDDDDDSESTFDDDFPNDD